jgi:hypothetical protein
MQRSVTLIVSNCYTSGELAVEYGHLPLCFLPDGNSRLYERQIEQAKHHSNVTYVVLPSCFVLSENERASISEAGAQILFVSQEFDSATVVNQVISRPDGTCTLRMIAGHSCDVLENEQSAAETLRDGYFCCRQTKLDARAFNVLSPSGNTITKRGQSKTKILAEAAWFSFLPEALKQYVPHLVCTNSQAASYELEILRLPLLSELYVFSALPMNAWKDALKQSKIFLEVCQRHRPHVTIFSHDFCRTFFEQMYFKKTRDRLSEYCQEANISLNEPWRVNSVECGSLNAVLENLLSAIPETTSQDITLWHGDFHFGNIFYSAFSNTFKTIDPRGMLPDGTQSVYGDARYDIAKLHHSVLGMYDYLMAGRYELVENAPYDWSLYFVANPAIDIDEIQRDFLTMRIGNYSCGDRSIVAISSLLYLSMIPLHYEKPALQRAMLVNGLRLAQSVIAKVTIEMLSISPSMRNIDNCAMERTG